MKLDAPFTILVDSREQLPYRYDGRDRVEGLDVGDYSGTEVLDDLRIERKSLSDFLGCVGRGRDRFERALGRMADYPQRYLLLEFTLEDLIGEVWKTWHRGPAGMRKSTRPIRIQSTQAIGSLFAWSLRFGVQPIFAGPHESERGREVGKRIVWKLVELATREKRRARNDESLAQHSEDSNHASGAREPQITLGDDST